MPLLISTLKSQHMLVNELISAINEAVAHDDTKQVSGLLTKMKVGLLAHLKLEDSQLYPGLMDSARDNNLTEVAETASTFAMAMRHISIGLASFLERYSQREFEMADFRKDWKNAAHELTMRICAEESLLYPMYERHVEPLATPS